MFFCNFAHGLITKASMRQLLTILALAGAIGMQAQKTYKIDINEHSRNNDEVL